MLLSIGKIHVVKVPSKNKDFFPYSHYKDEHSVGPIIECFYNELANTATLRIAGLAKLKPNVQKNANLRIDIYGPHTTASIFAQQLATQFGIGTAAKISLVNP